MLYDYINILEFIGLNFLLASVFLLICITIKDLVKKSNISKFGQFIAWLVLFLGCVSFILKSIIQLVLESSGL
ncbi:copper transport protein [Candidatus Photodesmus katoptron]|uniref:DUF2788 domain-containing protein n=1 Tax=Candidatus Photodesmus katoptron Akat1 TaxID=1236703 RepID=S3DGS6_9GAMM|nr:DUF2788 domain-containing protein [Candidatus Photodesmus katoptron]EPE37672.1 hypothetical protein O1U_0128 [Candidatus Photodesmus katoptron Akat1]KEY90608.1 copper transport protein [Candidatus Photodesmus katoptron]